MNASVSDGSADAHLLGFVARRGEAAQAAVEFAGAGRPLTLPELARAHVVVVAVSDDALSLVAADAADAGAARSCALWLHTSGVQGPEALAPLRERCGARIGALHPMAPFPDAESGYRALPGSFALLDSDAGPAAERLVERLLRPCGVTMLVGSVVDRRLYHAACALAANGVTALVGHAGGLLRTAVPGIVSARGGGALDAAATALGRAALRLAEQHGAVGALSGPVRRGDAEVVASHLESLARHRPRSLPVYRAVMDCALTLALEAGLDPAAARAVAAVLDRQDGVGDRRIDGD